MVKEDGQVRWSSPAAGYLKVNIDASCCIRGRSVGVGCTMRDVNGVLLKARDANILVSFEPRIAEIIDIQKALSWLKDGQNNVIESDALNVILDIRNPHRGDSDHLVLDCMELTKQLTNLHFVFVRQSANQAAHVLAHYARSMSGHQEWSNHYPEFLTSVIASDLS
ncbi:uncharacterized protein LOC126662025 [Mercurialis annua]|uniref:uncharacterized protein LOC126662025 n=1 Tax=Mercurialis annua TaxID=3986 RepID=UPI00215F0C5B|nr:uncharacterized protein LOC126662025 [Mercurialis annua]